MYGAISSKLSPKSDTYISAWFAEREGSESKSLMLFFSDEDLLLAFFNFSKELLIWFLIAITLYKTRALYGATWSQLSPKSDISRHYSLNEKEGSLKAPCFFGVDFFLALRSNLSEAEASRSTYWSSYILLKWYATLPRLYICYQSLQWLFHFIRLIAYSSLRVKLNATYWAYYFSRHVRHWDSY